MKKSRPATTFNLKIQCFFIDLYAEKPGHSSYQLEIRNRQIHSNSLCAHAPFVCLLIDYIAFQASNTCAG